jgi:hypothetical protein
MGVDTCGPWLPLGDLKGPEESRGNLKNHAGGIWEKLKGRIVEGNGRDLGKVSRGERETRKLFLYILVKSSPV